MIKIGKDMPLSTSWRLTQDDGPLKFWRMVLLFSLIAIAFQIGDHIFNYKDYVGPDPDDSMRLVEVRDFLAGQSWFDLHQYRLGPAGGTLMHWSRLIDFPIAGLITLFSFFMTPHAAEVAAVFIWPLLLVMPLMAATALAAYRLGGRQAMLMALILAALFLCSIIRFRPGAIDHHNVQLVLAITTAAMLLDPLARASNFVVAAAAGAVALAIGVETTPLVAVASAVVAALWAFYGAHYRRAAIGYGLTFALATGAIFFGTVPRSLWSDVTCDTLSSGYLGLAAIGGAGLALAAGLLGRGNRVVRYFALGAVGVAVAATAKLGMPQCLQNPYDSLDPLLLKMWLGSVQEAQSFIAEVNVNPESVGAFYAVGLLGMAVCIFRIMKGQQVTAYAVLLALIGVSWAVTLVQVRGMIFANFLASVPLAALIADLRDIYRAQQSNARAAVAFVLTAVASIPSVWAFVGAGVLEAGSAMAGTQTNEAEVEQEACMTPKHLKAISEMPPGRILSTANEGSTLLRFTPHAVLTANYHRNQAGMVAALKIGMAEPDDALQMIRDAKVGYVLLCRDDPQVGMMKKDYPNSFFARLVAGDVPEFLEPIDHGGGTDLLAFRVL